MIVIVTRSMAEQAGLINKKWAGGGPGPGGAGPAAVDRLVGLR